MAKAQIRALHEEFHAELAGYLAGLVDDGRDPGFDLAAETARIARRLRWQLVENPACRPDAPGGHVILDENGRIAGSHLAIPQRFVVADRSALGLLSADLRADPHVARYSGPMFLAYLRLPGADFHYATTANRNAGAFWEQRGIPPVPETELEFLRPVRPAPLLEDVALRRGVPSAVGVAVGVAGRIAGALAGPFLSRLGSRASAKLDIRPSDDWEQLSELARRCRAGPGPTHERSSAHLRWRYEACPEADRNQVFLIEDERGNRAWAALQIARIGTRRQLRELRLMDFVWPADVLDPADCLIAAFRQRLSECDVIRIKGGSIPRDLASRIGFRTRTLEGPTSYLSGVGADGASFASTAHFVAADSDTP